MLTETFDWISNIVALVMNPLSLLCFLVIVRCIRKNRKSENSQWWAGHQGRGV
jgi:hypothetical protein